MTPIGTMSDPALDEVSHRIALAQYPIMRVRSLEEHQTRITAWIEEAVTEEVDLVAFPEYAGMELTGMFSDEVAGDLYAASHALQEHLPAMHAFFTELAQRHGIYILAGSAPEFGEDGALRNVARLYAPSGKVGWQEKQILTPFEIRDWGMAHGRDLHVFETRLGIIGISICYDIEFPMIARAQAEAGATLILAPSSTDELAGYSRVKIGAQARALENQCHVAQMPIVGEAEWTPAIGENHGSAALYGPPDTGFPEDGVLAVGALNQPGWVYADIFPERLANVRHQGTVRNHIDWPRQGEAHLPPVTRISLL